MVDHSQIMNFPHCIFHRNGRAMARGSHAGPVQPTRVEQGAVIDVVLTADSNPFCIVRIDGYLNVHSYKELIAQVAEARARGARSAVIDLSKVKKIELSGHFAMHCLAALFRDQPLPDSRLGMRALKPLVEANLKAGLHDQIRLVCSDRELLVSLNGAGLDRVFPIFEELGTAFQTV
jgi:hypothetical protein